MAGLDIPVILAFAFGIIILYIVGRILFVPLKFVFRLLINGLVGGLLLWLINIVGEAFGFLLLLILLLLGCRNTRGSGVVL